MVPSDGRAFQWERGGVVTETWVQTRQVIKGSAGTALMGFESAPLNEAQTAVEQLISISLCSITLSVHHVLMLKTNLQTFSTVIRVAGGTGGGGGLLLVSCLGNLNKLAR